MTLAELLALDVIVVAAVLAFVIVAGVQRRNAWPAHAARLTCDVCGRTFRDQRTLHLHARANHMTNGMYPYDMDERELDRIHAVPAVQTASDQIGTDS